MTGWFSDALDAAQAKADEEEKLRQIQAQANAGDVPVAAQAPSPAGAFFGQQLSQPTYGPPQPTYQENVQAMAQQNPGAGQIAAGELGAADYYGSTAPVQASIAQRDQALQNFDQSGNGPFGIGNFDPVQAYNQIQESTRIPVWSDFAENVLGPAMNAAADPLGIQSYIQRNTLGTDIGAGDVALPVTGFDFATNLATGGGLTGFDDLARMGSTGLKTADNVFRGVPPEPGQVYRLGVQPESMIGVPDQNGLAASLGAMRVSDPAGARILQPDEPLLPGEREMWHGGLIKGPIRPDLYVSPAQRTAETFARNYGAFNAQPGLIERVTRAIMPEPNFTGGNFGAGIPPINPMGGEEAFGFGSRGGWREPLPPTTDLEGDLRRSLEARGVTPPPPEPPFPSAYPSIPEGTMGELFPDVVREQGVSASSPAARMGAPLAYDPQFMTPPPADAAMRDLGVAPVDDTAQQMRDAFQNVRRQEDILTGGGVPRVEPTQSTPPPASPSVTIGGPNTFSTPSATIDSLIDRGPAPSLNPTIGQLNPPGTGQQLAREAATNPALSQAQRDFLNSPNGQASADQLAGKLEQAASGGGTRPPDVPPTRTGNPGTGGSRPKSGNPLTDAYHAFMDFFYGPYGMDRSDIGRQSVMRTINPFYAADTARSIKASTRAMFDKNFAETLDKSIRGELEAHGIKPPMADWRGSSGFADRESGVSKIWNLIPGYDALNRGFAAGINTQRYGPMLRLLDNKPTWAEGERGVQRLQHLANYNAIATGRGSFGNATIDKALASVTGPIFTSARNAISWPERVTYLFPIQKTGTGYGLNNLDLFGPAWRTAVKDHSGYIIAGLGIMAGAERLGADVDYRTGDIKVGDHHYNFWGGGYGWVKMAHDVYTKSSGGTLDSPTKLFSKAEGSKEYPPFFDTSKGNWRGSAAEFFRNKAGPGLEAVAAGLRVSGYDKKLGIENAIDFLRPEYWDRGVTGRDLGWADRALQFVTFLNLQDIAKSVWAPGQNPGLNLESAEQAAMALPSSVGVTSSTYASLTEMRRDVKDDPSLPPEIRGVEPSKLGSDGIAAVDKLVQAQNPEKYKDVKEMNSRPVFERYRETTAKIQQTVDERSTKLYDALREGRINGEQVRQGREIINSSAKAQRDAARNDPDYKKALSELEKNEVSKALDAYYKIWDSTPKLADGKVDYDKIELRQSNFLKFAEQKDPETARLLRFELNTEKDRTNPLEKLYDLAKPMLERYGNIKDDYARSQAQRNNPREDAFLALLGYGKPQSPEAAQLLQQMRQSLPASNVPVAAAPVQRSVAPAAITAAPAPAALASNIGPNGRTVAEITGKPYLSDAERNWYFESRGLPVPQVGAPAPAPPSAPVRTGYAPEPTGARLPPVAPGEFNSPTASPQQRQNFINAMAGPANAYSYTGIPPSVWAAMGASESNWGRAPSVFGIKGVGSAGGANLQTHEILGGKRVDMPDQFAAYNNLDDAFKHFIDLTSGGRYANAWNHLQTTGDWQGFLQGIVQAGYATDKTWPTSIISLANHIEKTYPHINQR